MRKLVLITALLLIAGISYGQTLKKGGMVAIHEYTLTLAPNITMNQYMDFFIEKYIPEANKLLDGVKLFALKGDRGEHENGFALLVWCESTTARNKYWQEAGSGSDEYREVTDKLQPLYDELQKMGTVETVYTEWLIQ